MAEESNPAFTVKVFLSGLLNIVCLFKYVFHLNVYLSDDINFRLNGNLII